MAGRPPRVPAAVVAEVAEPKSDALRSLYWRSEILQVMFWLQGEGFGDIVDAPLLERFLGVEARMGLAYLNRLVDEDYLVRDGEWFRLSVKGQAEGSAEFASSFEDLLKPTHGECSADCWCHASPEEADACVASRQRHGADGENGARP